MADADSDFDQNNSSPSEEKIFINAADGLPNKHPTLPEIDSDNECGIHDDTFDDLPTSIIVTNIHSEVYVNDEIKMEMEDLFRRFSDNVTFQWLKSFKRLRVNYDTTRAAANARIQLHQYPFYKSTISCYFAQPVTPISSKNLQLPPLVKQFLISPPASPPVGWEPREEGEPILNHDLLMALSNLTPGESHELHPPTESQPAIIVHTALNQAAISINPTEEEKSISNIPQTRCPERT